MDHDNHHGNRNNHGSRKTHDNHNNHSSHNNHITSHNQYDHTTPRNLPKPSLELAQMQHSQPMTTATTPESKPSAHAKTSPSTPTKHKHEKATRHTRQHSDHNQSDHRALKDLEDDDFDDSSTQVIELDFAPCREVTMKRRNRWTTRSSDNVKYYDIASSAASATSSRSKHSKSKYSRNSSEQQHNQQQEQTSKPKVTPQELTVQAGLTQHPSFDYKRREYPITITTTFVEDTNALRRNLRYHMINKLHIQSSHFHFHSTGRGKVTFTKIEHAKRLLDEATLSICGRTLYFTPWDRSQLYELVSRSTQTTPRGMSSSATSATAVDKPPGLSVNSRITAVTTYIDTSARTFTLRNYSKRGQYTCEWCHVFLTNAGGPNGHVTIQRSDAGIHVEVHDEGGKTVLSLGTLFTFRGSKYTRMMQVDQTDYMFDFEGSSHAEAFEEAWERLRVTWRNPGVATTSTTKIHTDDTGSQQQSKPPPITSAYDYLMNATLMFHTPTVNSEPAGTTTMPPSTSRHGTVQSETLGAIALTHEPLAVHAINKKSTQNRVRRQQ